MNIFTFLFIVALMPFVLGGRWVLIKCGVEDPEDWQIFSLLGGVAFAAIWISGIWLA